MKKTNYVEAYVGDDGGGFGTNIRSYETYPGSFEVGPMALIVNGYVETEEGLIPVLGEDGFVPLYSLEWRKLPGDRDRFLGFYQCVCKYHPDSHCDVCRD